MLGITIKIENLGQRLYMDSFLSPPDLLDDLYTQAINCCGTVRSNQKGMPWDPESKLRLKWGNIMIRVRGDLTATVLEYKQNVNLLTNMDHPSAKGNFCDKQGNTLKIPRVQGYNRHMRYED
jgi:hypothetical protein